MAQNEALHEQPTAPVNVLAAQRGLGDWVDTYASKQGWTYRMWRDWRLYVYGGGVVVTGRDGFDAVYDWGTTRVVEYRRRVNGSLVDARYTLIDPRGSALNIGPGSRALLKKEKRSLGITELVSGAPFLYPGDWGDYIQRNVTRAQLSGTVARIGRGETVEFGPYKADRYGLTGRKQTAAWTKIVDFDVSYGMLSLRGADKRNVVDLEYTHYIPNVNLFLNLCQHLMGRTS